jgi:hypothetical protein
LDTELSEAFKWRKPCYTHDGKNIVIFQPFNDLCALMFFKGALLNDPKALLREQGDNSRSSLRLEFRSVADVTSMKTALRSTSTQPSNQRPARLASSARRTESWKASECTTERRRDPDDRGGRPSYPGDWSTRAVSRASAWPREESYAQPSRFRQPVWVAVRLEVAARS